MKHYYLFILLFGLFACSNDESATTRENEIEQEIIDGSREDLNLELPTDSPGVENIDTL